MKRKHAVSRILTNSPEPIPGEFYSGNRSQYPESFIVETGVNTWRVL